MKKTKNKKIMDYDGVPMTDDQLDEINEDGDFQHECIMNDIH